MRCNTAKCQVLVFSNGAITNKREQVTL
jgi:hypothetical protein